MDDDDDDDYGDDDDDDGKIWVKETLWNNPCAELLIVNLFPGSSKVEWTLWTFWVIHPSIIADVLVK